MSDIRFSDYDVSKRDIPSFIEPRPPLIQNPFMRPRPQKGTNLLELFEEDSEIEEPELVQVYLRLKPTKVRNTLYEVRSERCLVTTFDTATAGHGRRTQHNVSKMYTFSKIFDAECNQKEIFEEVVKSNLKKLPEGHNFTLLTYGASGSGKTYTLMGTVDSPGLVPRSLEYVFRLVDAAQLPAYKPAENGAEKLNYAEQDFELQWVKRLRHVSAPHRDKYRRMSVQLHTDLTISSIDLSSRVRHYVWVSFVEIYNEAIYDLLAPPEKRTKLRIREDSSGNVYVKGASQAFVRSSEEAYDVMVAGKHNLMVAATGVHAHSSRSHCIFTITMLTETGDGGVRTSCIRLCDLAGCERARATGNTGARMQESRAINSSLLVLQRCLHMLRRKQKSRNDALVPYRESKLTRLLGPGFSGARGEAMSMVVTLNPAPAYAHESKHVLSLAVVAQDIQVNYTMLGSTLESSTQDTTINCSTEMMKLRADNERLHFEVVQAQARNKELMAAMDERQQETANTMMELVEEAKDMTRQYYETLLKALRSEMDDMVEEYESRLSKLTKEASASSEGTPSRFLQAKVAQLMTKNALLEEELSAERLARELAEREVEKLRRYIEEIDGKAIKDVIDISDHEDHSDDDINDPFNESLEPIFKKEDLNISVANQIDNISHTTDNVDDDDDDTDDEISKDTFIAANNDSVESNESVKYGTLNTTQEKAKNMEIIDDTNKRDFVCRGTYFISDNKSNDSYDISKDKNDTSLRGTYCVDAPAIDVSQNFESNDKDITIEVFKEPVIEKPTVKVAKKACETLVSKIICSLKSNQSSDSSLRQFEQLEIASKQCNDANEKITVLSDIKMLKEKKSYFDNEPSKSTQDTDEETPKEKRIYFDNIGANVEVTNKKFNEIQKTDEELSSLILKENFVDNEFEPNKFIKLHGERFAKPDDISSIHNRKMVKDSVDLFESPVVIHEKEKIHKIEIARQSENLVSNQQSAKKGGKLRNEANSPVKVDTSKSSVVITGSPNGKDTDKSHKINYTTKSIIKDNVKSHTRKDTKTSPTKDDYTKSSMINDTCKSTRKDNDKSPIRKETDKYLVREDYGAMSVINDTTKSTRKDNDKSPTRKYTDKSLAREDYAKSSVLKDTTKSLRQNHDKSPTRIDTDKSPKRDDKSLMVKDTSQSTRKDNDKLPLRKDTDKYLAREDYAKSSVIKDTTKSTGKENDKSPTIKDSNNSPTRDDYTKSSVIKDTTKSMRQNNHESPTRKDTDKSPSRDDYTKSLMIKDTSKSTRKDNDKSSTTKDIDKCPVREESESSVITKYTRKDNHKSPTTKDTNNSPTRDDYTKSLTIKDTSKSPRKDHDKSPTRKDTTETTRKDNHKLPTRKDTTETTRKDNHKLPTRKDTVKSPTKENCAESFIIKNITESIQTGKDHDKLANTKDTVKSSPMKDDTDLPLRNKTKDEENNYQPPIDKKKKIKLESTSSVEEKPTISDIKKEKLESTLSIDEPNKTTIDSNQTGTDNTIEEFENIYKDITAPRVTEFELLVSQTMNETTEKKSKTETKYNLRKKNSKIDDNKTDKHETGNCDEILLESHVNMEYKPRKRPLRLKRRKNQDEEESDAKLRDIANLQTEFSDLTMDVPAPLKVVIDIPSPEKGSEENLPPISGVQSCPARSITRSRRKLFTPRAEPLDESTSQTGDSNERIYVPRPSYHRPRARRKL